MFDDLFDGFNTASGMRSHVTEVARFDLAQVDSVSIPQAV